MEYSIRTYYLDNPLTSGRVFDVFEPENILKDVAIFIVHGGGWRCGSRTSFHEIMEAFCKRGYIVASTDYRLDAKDAFVQLSDIRASYDKFISLLKAKKRPLKVAVYGESAGAHLASLLICAAPGECGEENFLDNEWVKPCVGMLQATPVDFLPFESMMPSMRNTMSNIAGAPYESEPDRYERLSLKNYIRADNPPIFFMEAELEHLFSPKNTKEIVEKHHSLGIPSKWKMYRGMEHGFFYELKRNAQKEAFNDIILFLDGDFNE